MNKKVAVVIPYYHSELTEMEKISYQQCLKKLNNYPIFLVVPDSMDELSYPKEKEVKIKKVPAEWLTSISSYNTMMLEVNFYKIFEEYEFILVYQLDAFVFRDELERFCQYGFDYIGAPWTFEVKYSQDSEILYEVGNGGLSLRNIKSFIEIANHITPSEIDVAEDVFWASRESETFSVAPVEVALQFAFESEIESCYRLNGERLPFGCHAWEKYNLDFWKSFLHDEGYEVDALVGTGLDLEKVYQRKEHDLLEHKLKEKVFWIQFENGSLEEYRQRFIEYCDRYFNWKNKEVYIWGAGKKGGELGKILSWMKIDSFFYLDIDKEKEGTYLHQIEIKHPGTILEEKKNVVVIIAVMNKEKEILQQLEGVGYKYGKDVYFYENWRKSLL